MVNSSLASDAEELHRIFAYASWGCGEGSLGSAARVGAMRVWRAVAFLGGMQQAEGDCLVYDRLSAEVIL